MRPSQDLLRLQGPRLAEGKRKEKVKLIGWRLSELPPSFHAASTAVTSLRNCIQFVAS